MTETQKFTRLVKGKNKLNGRGTVQIVVKLIGPKGHHVRGNIVRSITLAEATVLEVIDQIVEKLVERTE